MPQRIPSPRELQFHTQSIMQNALIKKKLEEQRENFRKRQELQQQQQQQQQPSNSNNMEGNDQQQSNNSVSINRGVSPGIGANKIQQTHQHIASPTPTLAFTPTSVLRKMTAEKDIDNLTGSNASNSNNKDINKVCAFIEHLAFVCS